MLDVDAELLHLMNQKIVLGFGLSTLFFFFIGVFLRVVSVCLVDPGRANIPDFLDGNVTLLHDVLRFGLLGLFLLFLLLLLFRLFGLVDHVLDFLEVPVLRFGLRRNADEADLLGKVGIAALIVVVHDIVLGEVFVFFFESPVYGSWNRSSVLSF